MIVIATGPNEVETVRNGRRDRLVNAANRVVDPRSAPRGAGGVAASFEALTQVLCDNAKAHDAACIGVHPEVNGPGLDQPVNDSSQESMDAVAQLVVETGVPELG